MTNDYPEYDKEDAPFASAMEPELRPCPDCGDVRAAVIKDGDDGYYYYWRCPGCRRSGPLVDTEAEAAELWNTRAAQDTAA